MLEALKRMVLAAIDPRYEDKARELANLRAAAQQSGSYMQPGQWYRLLGADGGLQGFGFYCCQQYQLRDAVLWLRTHTCPQCKARISVLNACGIKPGTPAEKWPQLFAALPVLPQAAAQTKTVGPYHDTWAGFDEVGYETSDPCGASKQGR